MSKLAKKENENRSFLHKFSNVFITKGYNRSIVIDCLRGDYCYIPNEVAQFVKKNDGKPLTSKIYHIYEEYLQFLIENDFIFLSKNNVKKRFPPISKTWEYPSLISNAMIEINNDSLNEIIRRIKLINELGCSNFLFFNHSSLSVKSLQNILTKIQGNLIDSIDFYLQYSDEIKIEGENLIKTYPCIRLILLFKAPDDDLFLSGENRMGSIISIKKALNFNNYENKISQFNLTLQHYLESNKHHTFFNKKIFVSIDGQIKNSPNSTKSFGGFFELETAKALKKILITLEFQKLWYVTKKSCDVCNVCEYRRICIDKRVPYERGKEFYFKEECDYNPFINRWKGEKYYLNLEETEVLTNSEKYVINKEKIKRYNQKTWN